MPARLSHVVVLTDDLDSSSKFLVDVVGMAPGTDLEVADAQLVDVFGWAAGSGPTRGRMHGEAPGAVELIEIPEARRGTVRAGVQFLSFLSRDAQAAAERATALGLAPGTAADAPGPGGIDLKVLVVPADGTAFELIQITS